MDEYSSFDDVINDTDRVLRIFDSKWGDGWRLYRGDRNDRMQEIFKLSSEKEYCQISSIVSRDDEWEVDLDWSGKCYRRKSDAPKVYALQHEFIPHIITVDDNMICWRLELKSTWNTVNNYPHNAVFEISPAYEFERKNTILFLVDNKNWVSRSNTFFITREMKKQLGLTCDPNVYPVTLYSRIRSLDTDKVLAMGYFEFPWESEMFTYYDLIIHLGYIKSNSSYFITKTDKLNDPINNDLVQENC